MGVLEDIKVLEENRDKIRDCDIQILRLLEKRITAAAEIGKVKRKNNKPIYAPDIEKKNIETSSSMDFKVIYEDDNILVVNKPTNLLVHDGDDKLKNDDTLTKQVLNYLN